MSIICNITPAAAQMEETHNTLKFATRAKLVGRSTVGCVGGIQDCVCVGGGSGRHAAKVSDVCVCGW